MQPRYTPKAPQLTQQALGLRTVLRSAERYGSAKSPFLAPSSGRPWCTARFWMSHPGHVEPAQESWWPFGVQRAESERITMPVSAELSKDDETGEVARDWPVRCHLDGIAAVIRMGGTRARCARAGPPLPMDYKLSPVGGVSHD